MAWEQSYENERQSALSCGRRRTENSGIEMTVSVPPGISMLEGDTWGKIMSGLFALDSRGGAHEK